MKSFILSILIIIPTTSQSKVDKNKEVTLRVSDVKSIIKSSKDKHVNNYLFIAKVDQLTNGFITSKDATKNLVPKGTLIEVLLPKIACYEEIKLAILNTKLKVQINNIMLTKLIEAKPEKEYKYFTILKIKNAEDRNFPGCVISR